MFNRIRNSFKKLVNIYSRGLFEDNSFIPAITLINDNSVEIYLITVKSFVLVTGESTSKSSL